MFQQQSTQPSSQVSGPTDHTRQLVFSRDNQRCWVCEDPDNVILQVAHVLAPAATQKFEMFRNQGILPSSLQTVSQVENLILLCHNCHARFDASIPILIILPTNLTFFIDWEVEDYNRRVNAASRGEQVPRTVPASGDYSGEFRVYLLDSGRPNLDYAAKPWGGAPGAMILRAALGALQPTFHSPSTPLPTNLLSAEQRSQMATLMNYYSRPDPPLTPNTANGSNDESDDNPGRKRDKEKRKQPDRKKQRQYRRSGEGRGASNIRTRRPQRMTRPSTSTYSSGGPHHQLSLSSSGANAPWLFGPHLSTKEIIRDIKPSRANV